MSYSKTQVQELLAKFREVTSGLSELQLLCIRHGSEVENLQAREYLHQGAGRRAGILKRAIENIFSVFPPNQERPLRHEAILDVQINLHSFLVNLYGIFDNWAWAYLLHHGRVEMVGHRQNIGLFKSKTMALLPAPLRSYVSSETTSKWYETYLKQYRDALAHRIPVYIPPSTYSPEESSRYSELEDEKITCMGTQNSDGIRAIGDEQALLGGPCLLFLHSLSEYKDARPIYFHPQLMCDAGTVLEFGELFFEHWRENA